MSKVEGRVTIIQTSADGTVVRRYALHVLDEDTIFFETKDMDFGSSRQKYLDQITIEVTNPDKLGHAKLEVGYRDRLNDPLVWTTPFSVDLSDAKINLRLTARYFRLKFSDDIPIYRWKISGIAFRVQERGGRE